MAQPHIPIELYPSIIQFIPITDASTHICLSVVSQNFWYAAERALYRDIKIDLRNVEASSTLRSSLMKPRHGLCRTSYVRTFYTLGGRELAVLRMLNVIKHLNNLRERRYKGYPIVRGSVEALFEHGQCPFQLEKMTWCGLDATESLAFNAFIGTQQRLTHLSIICTRSLGVNFPLLYSYQQYNGWR